MNDEEFKSNQNKLDFTKFIRNIIGIDFSSMIFTRTKYLELKKSIEELQIKDIEDYKTFERIGKFEKLSNLGFKILEVYTFSEIINILSKFRIKTEYERRTKRLYPILRIFLVWKFYYLYMLFKFKLD